MKRSLNEIMSLDNIKLVNEYLFCISKIEKLVQEEAINEQMNKELSLLIDLNYGGYNSEEKQMDNHELLNFESDIETIINGLFDLESKNATCSICFNNQCDITLKCGHIFHSECSNTWLRENNTCPNCRKVVE